MVRWNLHAGFAYEEAKARYAPFTRLVDEDLPNRIALARLCLEAAGRGEPVFVIANKQGGQRAADAAQAGRADRDVRSPPASTSPLIGWAHLSLQRGSRLWYRGRSPWKRGPPEHGRTTESGCPGVPRAAHAWKDLGGPHQGARQRDLALAYSPGVAYACKAIEADPAQAARLTSRGNLVGVITNGTAVLGLGNIGPLAGKPVMEGKGCLFKKFAGIDVFDIELAEKDPDKLVDIISALEPTLGGINLEDIKAPECFYIERKLRERMKIPVFHDDQHGTAIIVGAAVINGLKVVGKDISKVKLVCSGAGASAIACLDLLDAPGAEPRTSPSATARA